LSVDIHASVIIVALSSFTCNSSKYTHFLLLYLQAKTLHIDGGNYQRPRYNTFPHQQHPQQETNDEDNDILFHAFNNQSEYLPATHNCTINRISISGGFQVTNDTLAAISECFPNLQGLILNNLSMSPMIQPTADTYNVEGIRYVLTHCTSFSELAITRVHNEMLSNDDVLPLIPDLRHIEQLKLHLNMYMTTQTAILIIQQCSKLQRLAVNSCRQVDMNKLRQFIKANPQYKHILLHDVSVEKTDAMTQMRESEAENTYDPFSFSTDNVMVSMSGEVHVAGEHTMGYGSGYGEGFGVPVGFAPPLPPNFAALPPNFGIPFGAPVPHPFMIPGPHLGMPPPAFALPQGAPLTAFGLPHNIGVPPTHVVLPTGINGAVPHAPAMPPVHVFGQPVQLLPQHHVFAPPPTHQPQTFVPPPMHQQLMFAPPPTHQQHVFVPPPQVFNASTLPNDVQATEQMQRASVDVDVRINNVREQRALLRQQHQIHQQAMSQRLLEERQQRRMLRQQQFNVTQVQLEEKQRAFSDLSMSHMRTQPTHSQNNIPPVADNAVSSYVPYADTGNVK
jgi:hypothetical protein